MVVIAPVVPHKPGTWRVIYFDAPNRGEQIRILLALANTPFEDVRVSPFPQGLDPYKKAALGDDSPLLGTDLCPAVTAPDGTHCVETTDIMRFVGQRVGMAPEADSAEDKKAMEAVEALKTCVATKVPRSTQTSRRQATTGSAGSPLRSMLTLPTSGGLV